MVEQDQENIRSDKYFFCIFLLDDDDICCVLPSEIFFVWLLAWFSALKFLFRPSQELNITVHPSQHGVYPCYSHLPSLGLYPSTHFPKCTCPNVVKMLWLYLPPTLPLATMFSRKSLLVNKMFCHLPSAVVPTSGPNKWRPYQPQAMGSRIPGWFWDWLL